MSTESSVVSLTGVSKIFVESGANRVVALRDIDLDVLSCEFISLIGPSGWGKSTLLRLIGDLTPPTSGEVRVNNKTAHQARLNEDYGMVFQAPVLYE